MIDLSNLSRLLLNTEYASMGEEPCCIEASLLPIPLTSLSVMLNISDNVCINAVLVSVFLRRLEKNILMASAYLPSKHNVSPLK
ncbi:hypothetical protein KNCP2_13640 [Candidatus Rickettsia kedanie]|uniref:Uncharacterized protein n=1 Tax=Candidatus Rickettsia kedanie TaxID=3115352 RepID=A0ABP9TX08_9RICK